MDIFGQRALLCRRLINPHKSGYNNFLARRQRRQRRMLPLPPDHQPNISVQRMLPVILPRVTQDSPNREHGDQGLSSTQNAHDLVDSVERMELDGVRDEPTQIPLAGESRLRYPQHIGCIYSHHILQRSPASPYTPIEGFLKQVDADLNSGQPSVHSSILAPKTSVFLARLRYQVALLRIKVCLVF
ncbi:hypothetical protein BC827DRAFT_520208 [Russula dissimulans]|nr:hypothetical protein BC827DRAFT_520208 [Russula dissimulans]